MNYSVFGEKTLRTITWERVGSRTFDQNITLTKANYSIQPIRSPLANAYLIWACLIIQRLGKSKDNKDIG